MTRRLAAIALALLALYLLYGYKLAARDLWSSHEARAAMNATTLLDGAGPPLVPYKFDGSPELQKPPLYYALVAGCGWLLGGVDALAVRLPAMLAGLATLALLAGWLAARGRPVMGLVAVTVLAVGVHFTLLARTGRIDMPLTFTTLAAVLGYLEAIRQNRLALAYLGHIAMAAGILLKGPIAVLLVAAVLGPWLLVERVPWRDLGRLHPIRGGLVIAMLVVPWLWWIDANSDGSFFRVFLWEHNLERGLGTGRLRSYPGWYYVPLLLVNGLPWSPLLLVALCRGPHRDPEARVGLVALAGLLALLSLAAFKRADYLAPLYPFAALVVAGWICPKPTHGNAWGYACTIVLLLAGLTQCAYIETQLARAEPQRELATFARTIRDRARPDESILLYRTECHLLAYHLGPACSILVHRPDLAKRVRQLGSVLVVTPAATADELHGERLADNGPTHDKPLVLLRLRVRYPD